MTDRDLANDGRVPIAPADYADPALGFAVGADGEVVVTAVNEAFLALTPDSAGTPSSEPTLASTLDECLTDSDGQRLAAALAADDPLPDTVQFETESASRLLRRARPSATAVGHLVFVELPTRAADSSPVAPEALAQAISHDLRNPLDVARAHLRASMDAHPDDEHLETVLASHDRMEQIIDDVLTLARGERALDRSEGVDLTAVLADAWESVATADATLAVEGDLPTTAADRRRVERLFENLLRNSVEHGASDDPDAAELTVEAGRLDRARGFYLADDGVGVPSAERSAVFEAGYTGTDHGTGLGLAIVDRIAVAHGWTVSLTESKTGGARVEVRFGDKGGETDD